MPAVEIIRNQQHASFVITNKDLVRGRVLDVGCGSKPYKPLFPECEWVGLDNRPVGDVETDMVQLPFEDASFDTVFCIDSLNFTPYPHVAIYEMARVLKPGGNMVITVRTTADDDSVFFGIHSAGLVRMLLDADLVGIEGDTRALSLSGLFSRAEVDNFWTNHTWLEGVGNGEVDRFTAYLDNRYPAIAGVCCHKPLETKEQSDG